MWHQAHVLYIDIDNIHQYYIIMPSTHPPLIGPVNPNSTNETRTRRVSPTQQRVVASASPHKGASGPKSNAPMHKFRCDDGGATAPLLQTRLPSLMQAAGPARCH